MKGLPEKLVMAAIILSCGVVAHSDPSPRDRKVKRVPAAYQHKWQELNAAAALPLAAKVAATPVARTVVP